MTLGPARVYYPVGHCDHLGGPVGYVRRTGLCWRWPLIAHRKVPLEHRKPELAELFGAEQKAIDDHIQTRRANRE